MIDFRERGEFFALHTPPSPPPSSVSTPKKTHPERAPQVDEKMICYICYTTLDKRNTFL